ncbi:Zinc finger RING-CH-type [Arabidopsis thaliana x Arabidopsis arenosa]|uniref:Zinc finger RING-CH-type n=1 Tax=Arabidopsis thaliana x Arabidopsis arenosa TaxID=1240361 RepID=A0A8T1Z0J3_9BRAS|nr:Zinc finger RING-CH-type [Arabidopsis thaliana x Arabidopsis arenosa]
MDVFPAEKNQALPAEETDKDDDEDGVDLCRICRSPETPDNPLRYPCACRGSIKYVHQQCLLLWLNRRGFKQCEVCGISYSFVPVYSENAPQKLPWHEFLIGLLLRAIRVVVWGFVILFNAYCYSLHPWGREVAIENQRVFRVSEKFAFLLAGCIYSGFIGYVMAVMVLLRFIVDHLFGLYLVNGLGLGVVARFGVVLWKYMGILSDWWHDHLIRFRLFHAIMVGPGEVVILPRNARLHEFGAIRSFLFFLDDNSFAVLAISFCVSFFFVLLPFFMGKLVLALLLLFQRMEVAMQLLSGYSLGQEPVTVGYMTMLSLSFAYLGSFVTPSRNSIQTIARRLSLGFLLVAVAPPFLLWILAVKVWKNLSVVKDGFILCLKIGVLPLALGCWLDFCTLPIFGTRISKRLELLSNYPIIMIIHWAFGQICLMLAFNSMELIQKLVKKRLFWFLLDVTDPNYTITKLHIRQILFALVFHGSMMVIVVHLPIMTIFLISPSFFPIQFWIYDERIMFGSMAAYVFLVKLGPIEWLAELIKQAVEPIVHKWIITISSWLKLSEFLLENHADQNVRPLQNLDEWFLMYSIAEGSVVCFHGSQSDTNFEEDIGDNRFILRIGVILVLAALSMFLISTISMVFPILMGRVFFHSISFIIPFELKYDDLYGFWIGCYILRAIYIGTCFVFNHIMIGRTDLLLNLVLLWIRNALLFSIWISVIPALLGILIDLMIIIPLQVPLNEPPVYSFLRDWLIGLVVLHIWTYLTMFTRINCFATVGWREKLERIRNVGINWLPFTWLLQDVICSIMITLSTTLGFPFLVAYSLLPCLGVSVAVNLAVQRLIWPVLLAIIILGFVAKLTLDLFVYIHRVEYNDRYMVGDRVTDFTEDLE